MRFGVNYTPRSGWFHSWTHLDPRAVRDDMTAIRELLGADHVRIFPLWPVLQPNRTWIDPRAVDDVLRVVDIAAESGLRVSVDVLQGHLSSYDFLPSWVQTWHARNIFTDPDVVAAEAALVSLLARELSTHPGADGICVGNETVQFASERHPAPHSVSPEGARAWLVTLLGAARDAWPEGDHVHSFDDDVWFVDTQPFTPIHAVELGDLTTIHSWVFGRVGAVHGPDAPELGWFARYLCELAAAWGPGRRLWLQEAGTPLSVISPERAEDFTRETIEAVCGARGGGAAPGLEAITWWCSHDVSRDLADFPEVEYSLGLLDRGNRVKPTGRVFAELSDRFRSTGSPDESSEGLSPVTFRAKTSGIDRSVTSPGSAVFAEWSASARMGDVRPIVRATGGVL